MNKIFVTIATNYISVSTQITPLNKNLNPLRKILNSPKQFLYHTTITNIYLSTRNHYLNIKV